MDWIFIKSAKPSESLALPSKESENLYPLLSETYILPSEAATPKWFILRITIPWLASKIVYPWSYIVLSVS